MFLFGGADGDLVDSDPGGGSEEADGHDDEEDHTYTEDDEGCSYFGVGLVEVCIGDSLVGHSEKVIFHQKI